MSSEIKQYEPQLQAFNGKSARSTDEEITLALAPISIAFPKWAEGFGDDQLRLWQVMLRDIAPESLAQAVFAALGVCKFPPTIADIREQVAYRAPGPRNDVDANKLKPVPGRMFRLDPEEDRRQRMNQLRRTAGWKYDA